MRPDWRASQAPELTGVVPVASDSKGSPYKMRIAFSGPRVGRYCVHYPFARFRPANARTFARFPHMFMLHHRRVPFLLVS